MSPKPPAELARLQAAFGRSIATPLEFLDGDGNYTLRLEDYDVDAVRAVRSRGERTAAERIGVYNQQYWFRLLGIMQEEFPLTESLMGIQAFNRFAMAYLHAYPPDSARLRDLSNRLDDFAASFGAEEVVRESIALERIYIESFDAAQLPPPAPESADALATQPLRFQPHFALHDARHDLVELRRRLKSGDPVARDDVASAPATWAFWRGNGIQGVELGPLQAQLLRRLVEGTPLVAACEALVTMLSDDEVEFLLAHVQRWFAAWSTAGWFAEATDL